MASGYTSQSATVGSFTVRFYWTSEYHASSNTSTITVTPQVYNTGNYGGNLWACGYNLSSPGIYLGGSRAYSFDASWGSGYNLMCSANQNSWTNFPPYTGSISTITVSHNANGVASTTVRFLGTIVPTNFESYKKSLDSGNLTISFTQSAPYAISYNANGGSGAPSSQSIYANISYTLSSTKPTRTGYTFLGWSTSSTATTASYQPGQSVTPNGNLSLYAVWRKKSFVLSISQGNGSTISVEKNGSALSDGSTIYYGDVLAISISANTGYNIGTHTVNESDWTSGNYTVTSAVSVVSTANLIQYTLSITTSQQGVTTNIQRTLSPIGGGSIGAITNGAVLYYNDTISINYTLGGAYQLLTATVNGNDISEETLPYEMVVSGNIVLSITVKLGAIMYIANEAYQIFIGDGTNWNQYQAFIGNGSEFDQY